MKGIAGMMSTTVMLRRTRCVADGSRGVVNAIVMKNSQKNSDGDKFAI